MYAQWEKTKKVAYETKLPSSLETTAPKVFDTPLLDFQFDLLFGKLNAQLKVRLKTNEWIVYENLYLKDKTEQEVAKMLGYKTSEKNRSPGYKQIKNLKKIIIQKAKELISDGDLNL